MTRAEAISGIGCVIAFVGLWMVHPGLAVAGVGWFFTQVAKAMSQ